MPWTLDRGTRPLGHRYWERDTRWEKDTRTWTLGEGHKVMDTGRETLEHGQWIGTLENGDRERDTRTSSMVERHLGMDTGIGTLGHRQWKEGH